MIVSLFYCVVVVLSLLVVILCILDIVGLEQPLEGLRIGSSPRISPLLPASYSPLHRALVVLNPSLPLSALRPVMKRGVVLKPPRYDLKQLTDLT